MTLDACLNGLVGLIALLTSASVALHGVTMQPDRPNYPPGPMWLQLLMWGWSAFLMYRAAEFFSGAGAFDPPAVTLGQVGSAAFMLAVHVGLLVRQLRSWLPARIHAYIARLMDIASCGRAAALRAERRRNNAPLRPGVRRAAESPDVMGPALAALAIDGMNVVGPHEGPEALHNPFGALR